jgi:hypothetical protein
MAFEGVTICEFLSFAFGEPALLTLVNITICAQLSKVPHVNFLALLLVMKAGNGQQVNMSCLLAK